MKFFVIRVDVQGVRGHWLVAAGEASSTRL